MDEIETNKLGADDHLEQRIEYLEKINRWHMDALEMLASMGDMHGDVNKKRDLTNIFSVTRRYIQRVIDFEMTAFLSVNETTSGFELVDCEPQAMHEDIAKTIDILIDKGEFAWALNQNRAVEVRLEGSDRIVLLHVLASKTRVRGMFIGYLHVASDRPSSAPLGLLSIIFHNSAYAMESAELYKVISEHNKKLEATVVARTEELAHQYGHDGLTGLPNRLLFRDRMVQAMSHARRHNFCIAVILLDLDIFKRINDTLGHALGDKLLTEIALRLRDAMRNIEAVGKLGGDDSAITISRLGGDEFGILLTELNNIDPISAIVQRIMEALGEKIMIESHELHITGSIGISVYPGDGDDPEALLKNADVAMYHAKQLGGNNYQFYAEKMNTTTFHHLLLENQLRQGIDKQEFVLYFQPKVDIATGRISGSEALLRWDHPERGLVPPDEFIPICEYTGMITTVGDWVLQAACEQARQWQLQELRGTRVAVNLSAKQFRQSDILEKIIAVLDKTGLEPSYLEIEITESTLMENAEDTIIILNSLSELGITLSVDDFGTGYSSLNYLKRFPINILKIDRSFVRDVTKDSDDAAIVTAIIAMAHSMGLRVVAEGVETEEQLAFLRALDCDEMQGYFFSRPMAANHITQMMLSDKRLR